MLQASETDEVSDITDQAIHNPRPTDEKPTVVEWISRINDLLGVEAKTRAKVRKSIFDVGTALLEAMDQLSEEEFAIDAKTGLSDDSCGNYMRVAAAKHLQDPQLAPELPRGIGALILPTCSGSTRTSSRPPDAAGLTRRPLLRCFRCTSAYAKRRRCSSPSGGFLFAPNAR